MDFPTLLAEVIRRGIEAADQDYAKYPEKRRGAIAGFNACRGKTPEQLAKLLESARATTHRYYAEQVPTTIYWEARCFEAEVEWVANCLSVVLQNEGLPVIVPPTARALFNVDRIMKEAIQ